MFRFQKYFKIFGFTKKVWLMKKIFFWLSWIALYTAEYEDSSENHVVELKITIDSKTSKVKMQMVGLSNVWTGFALDTDKMAGDAYIMSKKRMYLLRKIEQKLFFHIIISWKMDCCSYDS